MFDTANTERMEAINRLKATMRKHGLNFSYLFSWEEVPGDDSEKLLEFLKQEFDIRWVKTAKIEKIDNGRNIRVTAEKNYLSLGLNNEKTKVTLKIDDGRSAEFIAKSENGKLNIYEYSEPDINADAKDKELQIKLWNITNLHAGK